MGLAGLPHPISPEEAAARDPLLALALVRLRRWKGECFALGAATAVVAGPPKERPETSVVGPPEAAAALLRYLAATGRLRPGDWLTVPDGVLSLSEVRSQLTFKDLWDPWVWMYHDAATMPPIEPVDVPGMNWTINWRPDARDLDEINQLLDGAYPGASFRPGDKGVWRWCGARTHYDNYLVAVGALLRLVPGGVPRLASVATRPRYRGQGIGSGLVTRMALAAEAFGNVAKRPVVSLSAYQAETRVVALYERLGFRLVHHLETVEVAGPLTQFSGSVGNAL
ncbi:MAG: GNAT family N-acetyltransferase [Bifidobacteriaceae bacterium]|nr:GNAT family N-acetyltransferase [Bifidobacteriaceae bacterium]